MPASDLSRRECCVSGWEQYGWHCGKQLLYFLKNPFHTAMNSTPCFHTSLASLQKLFLCISISLNLTEKKNLGKTLVKIEATKVITLTCHSSICETYENKSNKACLWVFWRGSLYVWIQFRCWLWAKDLNNRTVTNEPPSGNKVVFTKCVTDGIHSQKIWWLKTEYLFKRILCLFVEKISVCGN